ncbi:helix-turn-helix domain-containing protein [Peribacillus asahii]|uniref:helix-turn-helix domain-containing protein n=1 Tax=Peribacillus asahii TaxID=228899 RepID=UPI003821F2E4
MYKYHGRYGLNFDGTLGDYIRIIRKTKKINSVDLSKSVGKSGAYISQIESGKNKNPDYATLYKIFKQLGIDEEKIEDYLFHFGIKSPEYEAYEEEQTLIQMQMLVNPTKADLEHMEEEAEYYRKLEEREMLEEKIQKQHHLYNSHVSTDNGDDLIFDILNENIKMVNKVLNDVTEHLTEDGYNLVIGLSDTLNSMITNVTLYNFMGKFFSEKLTSLDNEGLTKVLNTLYEEINRINRERTAFGKPIQKTLIDKL